MNSIKIPSTRLYRLFEDKKMLLDNMKIMSNMIVDVENFNIMNEKVNQMIYNNVLNGKFTMCLRNDLPYDYNYFGSMKHIDKKLGTNFFEDSDNNEYIDYLKTNYIINELSKNNWNIYYDKQELKVIGRDTKVYNLFYITPYKLDKQKLKIQSNIIPYNGLPILKDLNNEYKDLKKKYEQNEMEISELI